MAEETKKPKTVKVADVLSKDDKAEKKSPAESKSAPAEQPKKKKARIKHTHVEHHYDREGKPAGHTVRHQPDDGSGEISHAAADLDGVHDSMEEHVGEPNHDEGGMMAAAQPGAAAAGPQPAPMAAAQPPMGA
jgi:hypothetical protein